MKLDKLFKKVKTFFGKDTREFIKHAKNYITARFFVKALGFISLPIITRILTPEDFGIISVYTSFILIFEVIMELNCRGSISRYYYEKNKDFASFFGTIFIFTIFVNLSFIGIFWLARNVFADFFNLNNDILFFAILVSALLVFLNCYLSYLRASKRSGQYSFISVLKSVFVLVISICLMLILKEKKYLGRIYADIFIVLLFAIYSIIRILEVVEFNFKVKYIKYSLLFGVPLIPHSLSGFLLAHFDRVIINQIHGATDTGLYSFAYQIGMIMSVFVVGMNNSWSPIFYGMMRDNANSRIYNLAKKYSKYIYLISIGLVLFANEIVIIMADKKYHSSIHIVPIIIGGYVFLFLYMVYSNYSFYRKKTLLISINTLIAGVVNIVLNYIFIPKYGYVAAAYTTIFSYMLLFVLHFINVKLVLKESESIPIKLILPNISFYFISVLLFYLNSFFNLHFLVFLLIKILYIFIIAFLFFGIKRFMNNK